MFSGHISGRFQSLDARIVMSFAGDSFDAISGQNDDGWTLQFGSDRKEIPKIGEEGVTSRRVGNSFPYTSSRIKTNAQRPLLGVSPAEIFVRPIFELIHEFDGVIARLSYFLQPLLEWQLLINRP